MKLETINPNRYCWFYEDNTDPDLEIEIHLINIDDFDEAKKKLKEFIDKIKAEKIMIGDLDKWN